MRGRSGVAGALCATLLAFRPTSAIELNIDDDESIKAAAYTAANGMMKFYNGNQTGGIPGLFPAPYYWWEAGAAFGALIDYWYYTGDTSFNPTTSEALLFQVGPDQNYEPPNQTKSLGNDDQAFWGMAAMTAAEAKFPNPPEDQPQWLALAQAVFNSQAPRWDNTSCAGGLKWQIFSFNNGYNYKNSISQGGFFNIAARLGAYTHNETYLDWARRMYDWTESVHLISDQFQVFDGTDDTLNCTELNHDQWSYNTGIFLHGAAVMWNQTEGDEQALWRTRVEGLIKGAAAFFYKDTQIMYEASCEPFGKCNVDQQSFKAYLSRWMAATTKLAPWTYDTIMPYLRASAQAAAAQCTGGDDGTVCGTKWYDNGVYDGTYGVGQQMNALEVIQSNLIQKVQGPVGNSTGGTSKGNPAAGSGGDGGITNRPSGPVGTSDKAGAGILTALIIVGILGGAWLLGLSEYGLYSLFTVALAFFVVAYGRRPYHERESSMSY